METKSINRHRINIYMCQKCDYKTSHKNNYELHLLTEQHLETTKLGDKFVCYECDYITSHKYEYEIHVSTDKHISTIVSIKNIKTLKLTRHVPFLYIDFIFVKIAQVPQVVQVAPSPPHKLQPPRRHRMHIRLHRWAA